jgi:hypothetical protein
MNSSALTRAAEHDLLVDPEISEVMREQGLVLRSFDGRPKGISVVAKLAG